MAGGRRRFFVGASALAVAFGFDSPPDVVAGFEGLVPGRFANVDFADVDFAVVDFPTGLRARVVVPEPAAVSGLVEGCDGGASGAV